MRAVLEAAGDQPVDTLDGVRVVEDDGVGPGAAGPGRGDDAGVGRGSDRGGRAGAAGRLDRRRRARGPVAGVRCVVRPGCRAAPAARPGRPAPGRDLGQRAGPRLRRRGRPAHVPATARTHRPRCVGLVLIGVLLAVALAQTRASAPAVARQRTELEARIATQTSTYDRTTQQVASLQAAGRRTEVTPARGHRAGRSRGRPGRRAGAAVRAGGRQRSGRQGHPRRRRDAATGDRPERRPRPGPRPAVRRQRPVGRGRRGGRGERPAADGAVGHPLGRGRDPRRLPSADPALRRGGDRRPVVAAGARSPTARPADALQALGTAYGIRSSVESAGRQTLPAASVGELRYARTTDR